MKSKVTVTVETLARKTGLDRAHIRLGLAGAIAGAILFFTLYVLGVEFIRQSAVTAGIVRTL